MQRITVAAARAAYEATGLRPEAKTTRTTMCACPIGAVAAANGLPFSGIEDYAAAIGLGPTYRGYFTSAFDFGSEEETIQKTATEARLGYADGLRCRRAFLGRVDKP